MWLKAKKRILLRLARLVLPQGLSSLEEAPMRAESIGAELGNEDRNLTMAEKDCVLTSSDDDVQGLSAFVAERLQCLSEGVWKS